MLQSFQMFSYVLLFVTKFNNTSVELAGQLFYAVGIVRKMKTLDVQRLNIHGIFPVFLTNKSNMYTHDPTKASLALLRSTHTSAFSLSPTPSQYFG